MHLSPEAKAEAQFAQLYPEAPAIGDVDHVLYRGFELKRSGLLRMIAPKQIVAAVSAFWRGHRGGMICGSITRLGGWFLVRGDQILWAHRETHVSDAPPLEALSGALAAQPV